MSIREGLRHAMQQLSGLDAAFVHQDSPRTPMHVTAVLVYDIGTDRRGALRIPVLRALVARNLDEVPQFRRKLRRIPMDVDTPYWVDVEAPDWAHHLSRCSIAPHTGWPGFMALVAELHARRMDLRRPLWDMCVVDGLRDIPGLPNRCQALVVRFHHAAIDGISLARVLAALHREEPPRDPGGSAAAPEPGYWDIWTRLNLRNIGRQYKFAETVSNLLPRVLRARRVRQSFDDLPPTLANRSHFNDRVAARRSVGGLAWPLADVLAIRRAVRHVTVNDIALSVVGGGLRRYLKERGKLPEASLVAGVPISLRGGDDADGGNRIATMRVGLATGSGDPVARLRLVHRYAVAGKKHIDAIGTGTVMDISESVNPNLLAQGIRLLAHASLVGDAPVPFHTMVSNVPGLPTPMHLGEAELVVPLGFGPVRDNMGLFHIVSNSASRVSLSFSACARLLPDPRDYARCLEAAFAELRDTAAGMQAGP